MLRIKDSSILAPEEDFPLLQKSLVIEGDKILEVGALLKDAEFSGVWVTPAFIDSHIHLIEYGLSLVLPDLRYASSIEEVMDSLNQTRKLFKDLKLLYAQNLAPERIKEKRGPTMKELNRITNEIPVIVRREDGHTVYLNKKAINVFLPESEEKDFYVGEENEKIVEALENTLPWEIKWEGLKKADKKLIENGILKVVAMVGNNSSENIDCEMLARYKDKMEVEIEIFCQTLSVERVKKLELPRIGGCILVDGSFGSHTAAISFPYADRKDSKGILYFKDEELFELIDKFNENKLQMTFHAIGDRAIKQVLKGYKKFVAKGNPLRHRIEHAELLDEELIEEIAELEIILSMQPGFLTQWGKSGGLYEERLGERYKDTNPFSTLLKNGVVIVAGSDAPITPPDPSLIFNGFLHHPNPLERITPQQAIRCYTYNGAFGVRKEKEEGSIKKGKLANILLFKEDPFKTLKFKPAVVIKEGRIIVDNLTKFCSI